MKIEKKKLKDLKPAPYNPRSISPEALEGLSKSIKRFGMVEPIIWNRKTKHVCGGHQRLKVLEAEGVTETDVVVVDLSAKEEKALNIALNSPAISGEFTPELDGLLSEIEVDLPDLYADLLFEQLKIYSPENENTELVKINEQYVVFVECESEIEQEKLFNEFTGRGLNCRLLTS